MSRKKTQKSTGKKMDAVYMPSLRALVDALFQEAFNLHWDWAKLARQSGLSYTTVKKLGRYQTKYPQYRTVQLLAIALGGRVDFNERDTHMIKRKRKITWTPKVFDAKKKKQKVA